MITFLPGDDWALTIERLRIIARTRPGDAADRATRRLAALERAGIDIRPWAETVRPGDPAAPAEPLGD